jgi:hypothetical protein
MSKNLNPIIFISDAPRSYSFTSRQSFGGQSRVPSIPNKSNHSESLLAQLRVAFDEAAREREIQSAMALPTRNGKYIEFHSQPGFDLILKSLDSTRFNDIKLLNVREIPHQDDKIETIATVYIPNGKEASFVQKINAFATELTKTGKPKNDLLVRSIESITIAVVESFWQSSQNLFPSVDPVWCEVWLRVDSNQDRQLIVGGFKELCQRLGISVRENRNLKFPERHVLLILANLDLLSQIIKSYDFIAEIRRAQETARSWIELNPEDQVEFVQNLVERLSISADNVSICLLDTGVNNGHPLISPVVDDSDCQSLVPEWGTDDRNGHGTLMAGLAIYGDLQKHLSSNSPVTISHIVESVKIYPPPPIINNPDLYGDLTKQAVSLSEIQAPERKRILTLAVGSKIDAERGRPSSWSAAVDQIAFGTDEPNDRTKRLFIVAAGNTDEAEIHLYPDASLSTSIDSPGQSWNALTVGAFTEKNDITDPSLSDYQPLALSGALSPFSTTSLVWEKKWPVKPDVVFEGGNAACNNQDNFTTEPDDLSLISTYYRPQTRLLHVFSKTSAASAQAAWFAAQILTNYPDTWPETVRALMVHSSDWTPQMKEQFLDRNQRSDYRRLMRSCGYGVPNLQKATKCLDNSLTLIAQEYIQPFTRREGRYVTNEMHLFELPWPKDVLRDMGEAQVKMRITLSYFIDPGPGEIGWKDRYRYASFGFRFDVNGPTETRDTFVSRINAEANSEEDRPLFQNQLSQRWRLGKQNRDIGSIHSDIWEGTAIDLSVCNMIAIFPTVGWWRERNQLGKWNQRARYSLVVSLETDRIDIPIYSSVVNLIRARVAIPINA